MTAEVSRLFDPPRCAGPSYDLREVDLLVADPLEDVVPGSEGPVESWARSLAAESVVYGLPAVLQYLQLHQTVLSDNAPVSFGQWRHDRNLATPEYGVFRTPNVDTLYSTAWLDISKRPVEITIPAMEERYYTLTFLDAFSNATNLSTRTLGPKGGTVWVTTTAWQGEVPDGVGLFRGATPYLWVLMRIFVRSPEDIVSVRELQDRVLLRQVHEATAVPETSVALPPWPVPPAEDTLSGSDCLLLLDHLLRRNGHPLQEEALVARFRGLGVGRAVPLDPTEWSTEFANAVQEGYEDALALVRSVLGRRGLDAGGTGWRTLRSGSYGFNYLHRAATNYVGLGGTTREESGPYTALVDSAGEQLDGQRGEYRLRFRPPPVDGFWSVTLYDLETRALVPNSLGRYAVNDLTEGMEWSSDGSLHLVLSPEQPEEGIWLPSPRGPFFVVLRAYLGRAEVVDGTWVPCPVERIA